MQKILIIASILPALLPCYLGSATSISHASHETDFYGSQTRIFQSDNKDVAITSIAQVGAPFATEGDTVTIQVGVTNNGSSEENFSVSLRDDTEDSEISFQQVTLAAGASTTINLSWDTTGVSGGPAPPSPPTPGTIHALTATATLSGDTDSSNDSMSLLPGIWIIAAPEVPKITYPEALEEPKVDYGAGLLLERPTVETEVELLTKSYVSPVQAKVNAVSSNPSLTTTEEALSKIFGSPVQGESTLGLSEADVSTTGDDLSTIFSGSVPAKSIALLANPNISTIVEEIPLITTDELQASMDSLLARPDVSTEPDPLTRIYLYRQHPNSLAGFSAPELATTVRPLTNIFGTPVDARTELAFSVPALETDVEEATLIHVEFAPAKASETLSDPALKTMGHPLTGLYNSELDATSSGEIGDSGLNTGAISLSSIFQSSVHGMASGIVSKPDFAIESTTSDPLLLVGEGEQPPTGTPITNLDEARTIRGRVKLEGRTLSLGAYVEIGSLITFVDRNGYFIMPVPDQTLDLSIKAPGYVSVAIPNISVGEGQTKVIPTVTLQFGDADGDGIIDLYDLYLVARNFGTRSRIITIQ